MVGVYEKIGLKVGEQKRLGNAQISAFELENAEYSIANLRYKRDGNGFMTYKNGKFIRLIVDGTLVMSDTEMERRTNEEFIEKANGSVFIAGLGIGLVLENLKEKVKSGIVTDITVIEISQDVIDLVSPYFKDMPITYICGDVLQHHVKDGVKYDTIYFDIWPEISTENLDEITFLHNRFKMKKNRNNRNAWMGSWVSDFLRKRRIKENKY